MQLDRRQLAFIVIVNAFISLVIALAVAWAVDSRRPDPEELAALTTPSAQSVRAPTPAPLAQEAAANSPPASQSLAAEPGESEEETVYIVQANDSLLTIATRYDVSVDAIVRANSLTNPDFVFSGQRLIIPAGAASVAQDPEAIADAPARAGSPVIAAVENPGELNAEVVVIVNESNDPVNLLGWQLARENGPGYTFGPVQLFAGSSVSLYSGEGTDSTISLYWQQEAPLWSGGSVALLRNRNGDEVDRLVVSGE